MVFPSRPVPLPCPREKAVGEIARAEAHEMAENGLLFRCGVPVFALEHRERLDGGDIVPCPSFPAMGECAWPTQMEIRLGNDQGLGGQDFVHSHVLAFEVAPVEGC